MALYLFDGFEGVSGIFSTQLTRSASYARSGFYGYGWSSFSPARNKTRGGIILTHKLVMGIAFRWTNETNGIFGLLDLYNIHPTQELTGVRLGINSQRLLYIESPSPGGTYSFRALSTFQLRLNTWYYLEIYAECSKGGGDIVVQVNGPGGLAGTTGAEILSLNTFTCHPDASSELFSGCSFGVIGGFVNENKYCAFDDVYVGSGDVFVGDVGMSNLILEDDRVVQFIRSSGTKNYQMVDENPTDNDTTYNETEFDDYEDILEATDISSVGTIIGVQVVPRAKKTGLPSWSMKSLCQLSGNTDYSEPEFLTFNSYTTLIPGIFAEAPGSLPWTLARLNAAGFGYKANSPLGA